MHSSMDYRSDQSRVDDKAAKTLLGDSFKRQLKYDGEYSVVTFICSKTDDISIIEVINSLGLDDEVAALEEQRAQFDEQIENKIDDLKQSKEVYRLAMSTAADGIEVWEGFRDQQDGGKSVFAPSPKTNKRKRTGSTWQSRKKRQRSDNESDDDFLASVVDKPNSDDEVTFQAARTKLSESDIKDKLRELKETKENARRKGYQGDRP